MKNKILVELYNRVIEGKAPLEEFRRKTCEVYYEKCFWEEEERANRTIAFRLMELVGLNGKGL